MSTTDPENPGVREDHPAPNGFGCPIDLSDDGLLWFINKHLLHPRGYALGFNRQVSADDATPERPQFVLFYPDGGNAVGFGNDLGREGQSLPEAANAAFARAAESLYALAGGYPFTDDEDEPAGSEAPARTPHAE